MLEGYKRNRSHGKQPDIVVCARSITGASQTPTRAASWASSNSLTCRLTVTRAGEGDRKFMEVTENGQGIFFVSG